MKTIRIGNDINVIWKFFSRNGMKFSLEGKILRLWLMSGPFKKEITDYEVALRNEIHFFIDADDLHRLGVYKILLSVLDDQAETEDASFDVTEVFQLVSRSYFSTESQILDGKGILLVVQSILMDAYTSPLEGASAYEIAVKHGFEGTEEEWLVSLKGNKGDPGKSAYKVAVEHGYEGTEEEWINDATGAGAKGVGISEWDVDESQEDSGTSVLSITLSNGESKSVNIKNGKGIASVVQTTVAEGNGEDNVVRITMSDGTTKDIVIKNGKSDAGLFPTSSALESAIPSPNVGDYAFVGDSFPASIYICATEGTWEDSGETYDGDSVVLTDYAKKSELTELSQEVNGIPAGTLKEVEYDIEDAFPYQINSNGHFVYNATNYLCTFVAITPGKTYVVRSSSYIAVLQELPDTTVTTTTQKAKFATGFSGRILLDAGVDYSFTAPSDAAYLFLFIKNVDPAPSLYEVLQKKSGLVERVGDLEDVEERLYEEEAVNLAYFTGSLIYPSGETYATTQTGTYYVRVGSVHPGEEYILTCTSETFYTILESYSAPSVGDLVDYATGYSGNVVFNGSTQVIIPEDGNFLCVFTRRSGVSTGVTAKKRQFVTDIVMELANREASPALVYGKEILVYRQHYLRASNGELADAVLFSTSDYINVEGITRVRLPYAGQTSSACPIAFYDRNKKFMWSVPNVFDSHELFSVDIPTGAKYLRVCSQIDIEVYAFSLYGTPIVSDTDYGIFQNPFVGLGGLNSKVIVSSADSIPSLPKTRCAGSMAKNGNVVYTIATCTPNGYDSGKRISVFKAYNVATEETIATSIVFDGGNGAYMNEVVFYDANGVLGTSGTLYAFAIYHADYTKNYIAETDPADLDFVYKTSVDGGASWGDATSLKSLLPDGYLSVGCSPSNPIVLNNGTFCLAGFFMKNQGTGVSKYRSGLITKKVGYDWKAIPLDIDDTNIGDNETCIVEYGINSVMLNIRPNYSSYSRSVYYTSEILPGEDFTFHRHPSSGTFEVPNRNLCQGSIIKFNDLYFLSTVDFTCETDRQNILLYISPDACKWYPLLYYFKGTTRGYSHLLVYDNRLLVMYESENYTVDYADLTDRVDELLAGGIETILRHVPDWRLLQAAKYRDELS